MKVQLLVVEGNARATSDVMESLGGTPYGIAYAALLESFDERVQCTVVYPSEVGIDCLPNGKTFSDYHGIVWTGSALNCYATAPEVTHQIELARDAYASTVPIFGSCWGLQVMTLALGGTIRCNPNGRELGIGRAIALTEAGKSHPMYAGKGESFDALEVHMDEVETLAEDSVVLSGNAMSAVQALAIDRGDSSFWGVQYHPEFDFATMAIVMQRLRDALLADGLFESREAIDAAIARCAASEIDPTTDDSVNDPHQRRLEITNWLKAKVLID